MGFGNETTSWSTCSLTISRCSKYEVSDSEMSFGGEGEGGEEQDRAQLIAHFQVGRLSLELCPQVGVLDGIVCRTEFDVHMQLPNVIAPLYIYIITFT